MRRALHSLALVAILGSPAIAQELDEDCVAAVHDVAGGREIADLSGDACLEGLGAMGVQYERILDSVDGVTAPVRVTGPLGGVELSSGAGVIDCRLALALATWAPELRAAGIRQLRAASIHRPGARVRRSGRVSGHARALALDLSAVVLEDGSVVSILNGWEAREPGADPCGAFEEGPRSARLRRVVCAAVRAELFQVVLTPHHDRSHQNHLHLELVPNVPWSFVR